VAEQDPTLGRMMILLDQWEAQGDRRCIFLRCYAMMTTHMLTGVTGGRFHDAPWVLGLLEHFVEYYFTNLDAYDRGIVDVPRAWRQAHDLARDSNTLPGEDLLLGINAHINHDLPLALFDCLTQEWPANSSDQRQERYEDFCMVNTVLAETIDGVQREVVERYDHFLRLLDQPFIPMVRVLEWEVCNVISAWREEVWEYARRLLEAEEADRAAVRLAIDEGASRRARLVVTECEARRLLAAPIEHLQRIHPDRRAFDLGIDPLHADAAGSQEAPDRRDVTASGG